MKRIYILLTIALVAILTGCAAKENKNKIAITAHRGFWNCEEAGYMENTIASLAQAQDKGFWGSEFDIHITADDQILVNHDQTLGGKDIHEMPLDSFLMMTLKNGEHPATLNDLLIISKNKPNTVLVCELKPHDNPEKEDLLVRKTIDLLNIYDLYDPDRVIFITFSLDMAKKVAELCPEFTNQFLEGAERDLGPQEIHDMGINGIDYHFSKFQAHPEWVEQAHKLGMSVNVWTVDDEDVIREMIDLGVDCITTNEPLKVREILGDRELKLNR